MTDPGGNVARRTSPSETSGRRRPWTWETRCHSPGWGLGGGAPRGDDRAVLAHAAKVVAHEVDDHHVLGGVLDRAAQVRECRRGHRRVGVPRDRSLDGAGDDVAAPAAQEQLRRQRCDPATGGVKGGRVGRVDVRKRGGEQVGGPGVGARDVQAQADIGLEDLARRDPPAALGDGVEVVAGVVPAQAQRRHLRVGEGGEVVAEPAAQVAQPALERVASLVGDERLEPPPPVGVASQDVVVVGQVKVGERDRPDGVQRDALDAGSQAVAQPAEPAAADGRTRGRRRDGRHGGEQGEGVLAVCGDAQRVRARDRATRRAGPSSGEGEGQRVALGEDGRRTPAGESFGGSRAGRALTSPRAMTEATLRWA